jgi:hypothetical protein
LAIKAEGFEKRREGFLLGLGGRSAVGFYGHSLSSFSGSWTRVAASVPRDARVLPEDLHLEAAV